MARIRTIKPEFFRHEVLYEAEIETGLPLRIAFAGLWTAADREGRFRWLPRQLKLDCLPYDEVDFAAVLDALATRGLIVRYACGTGNDYGYIPSWHKHQAINNREKASEFPDPPRVDDASATRAERDTGMHVYARGEGKGREGNENSARARVNANGRSGFQAEFDDEFWPAWKQNRVGEGHARRAFVEARTKAALAEIVEGARRYQAGKPEWAQWASPARWLEGERWKDAPSKPGEKPPPTPGRPTEWISTDDPRWPQVANGRKALPCRDHPGEKGLHIPVDELRGLMPPVPEKMKRGAA